MTFQLPRDCLIIFSFSLSGRFVKNRTATRYQHKLTLSSFSFFAVTLFSEISSRLEQLSVGVGGGQGVLTGDLYDFSTATRLFNHFSIFFI